MRHFMHKSAAIILGIFVASLFYLPGFSANAVAAGKDDVKIVVEEVPEAEEAGAQGGSALFAGLSKGTIVAGAVATAIVVGAVVAASNSRSTDHH